MPAKAATENCNVITDPIDLETRSRSRVLGSLRRAAIPAWKGVCAALGVLFDGVASDPLRSLAAKKRNLMGTLLVIVGVTLGLALRAASVSRRASVAESESGDELGVGDAYVRTSLLVLLCLLGLLALGLTYGNVLGAGSGP